MEHSMNEILQLLQNPLVWKILIGYWVFSAFVGALETPTTTDPRWYRMLFRFLHTLAGNVNRAALTFRVPGADNADTTTKPNP